MLNIAVIGAGSGKGQEYVAALQERQDIRIVACVINEKIPDCIARLPPEVKIIPHGDVPRLISEVRMGYHIIDVVVDFFGQPQSVEATFGYKFEEMESERLEDSSTLTFSYADRSLHGTVLLDRHAENKEERFEIQGTLGSMVITPTTYDLSIDSRLVKHEEKRLSKIQIIQAMFDVCIAQRDDNAMLERQFSRNMQTLSIIDEAYRQKS